MRDSDGGKAVLAQRRVWILAVWSSVRGVFDRARVYLLIATGPYCGGETASEQLYLCECVGSHWDCVETGKSGGVVSRGWCDGGDGTADGG
jgi:hypothetical protein